MSLPSLRKLEGGALHGKRVFARVDWNEPVAEGVVKDDFRIQKTLSSLRFILAHAEHLTIATHLEEDDGDVTPLFEKFLSFPGIREHQSKISMLENLRKDPREKANDPAFAAELARMADIYVNEAFAVSHREHASIVGIPKLLPPYAGYTLEDEVRELGRVFTPEHPFVAVLGGAKFETKIALTKRFSELSDTIFISGALCIEFFRSKGYEMGCSIETPVLHEVAEFLHNAKIQLPKDIITEKGEVKRPDQVGKDDAVRDIGPATVREMTDAIAKAKLVVWNGPLGKYEDGFTKATDDLAEAIAKSGAYSIVGGGDTLTSIKKLDLLSKFDFVSTGGGAMLDFIAEGTLPGIEALKN
ncbi:MAG: phosphoglycerate kinase [Patescibacteria group bacterium]